MTTSQVLGACTSTVATGCAATLLPNTGASAYLTIALAVGVGLVTWGVMYARAR